MNSIIEFLYRPFSFSELIILPTASSNAETLATKIMFPENFLNIYICKTSKPERVFLALLVILGYKAKYLSGTCKGLCTSWKGKYRNSGFFFVNVEA